MTKRKKARYGSGSIYWRGKTATIKWRDRHGKQCTKGGFKTQEEAQARLSAELAELDRIESDKPIDPESIPKLGELAEAWIRTRMSDQLHRSARDDKNRWNAYWKDSVGHLRPHEVDTAVVTRVVKSLLAKNGLKPNTVANALRMLSTFFSDLIEEGRATVNPVRMLPKKTRRLVKSTEVDEGFVEKIKDVARIIVELRKQSEQVSVAYAIGSLAGLRTGELLGLEWRDVDLDRCVIHVRRQVRHGKVGPVKDGDEREVGIQDALLPIVTTWKLQTGGQGQLLRPMAKGRGGTKTTPARYMKSATLTKQLHTALGALKLSEKDADGKETCLTWYQATRHTFASHYMMAGGDLAKLQAEMGHSDIQTTQRYAKLAPDFRTEKDRKLLKLPKIKEGRVVRLEIGNKLVANGKKLKQ